MYYNASSKLIFHAPQYLLHFKILACQAKLMLCILTIEGLAIQFRLANTLQGNMPFIALRRLVFSNIFCMTIIETHGLRLLLKAPAKGTIC
jgi:hypothetical protein